MKTVWASCVYQLLGLFPWRSWVMWLVRCSVGWVGCGWTELDTGCQWPVWTQHLVQLKNLYVIKTRYIPRVNMTLCMHVVYWNCLLGRFLTRPQQMVLHHLLIAAPMTLIAPFGSLYKPPQNIVRILWSWCVPWNDKQISWSVVWLSVASLNLTPGTDPVWYQN